MGLRGLLRAGGPARVGPTAGSSRISSTTWRFITLRTVHSASRVPYRVEMSFCWHSLMTGRFAVDVGSAAALMGRAMAVGLLAGVVAVLVPVSPAVATT
jgi:hypothetical protein